MPNASLKDLSEFCEEHETISIINDVYIWFFKISFTSYIVLGFAVIYLKSEEDLLANVSTLNYLLKVSEFQKYRKTELS